MQVWCIWDSSIWSTDTISILHINHHVSARESIPQPSTLLLLLSSCCSAILLSLLPSDQVISSMHSLFMHGLLLYCRLRNICIQCMNLIIIWGLHFINVISVKPYWWMQYKLDFFRTSLYCWGKEKKINRKDLWWSFFLVFTCLSLT